MEEDNNSPGGSNSNGAPQPPPQAPTTPYRVRRPSASIISSTTPMFQPPASPMAHGHHSRQRQQNNILNNFGPGDIDDDIVLPSSNLRSRILSAASASSSASSSSSYNNRPQSPLGSPDSTAFWAPSPIAHHSSNSNNNNSSSSYRAPLTPGGMCQVSSSTSDDIPQSPFSPEDLGSNSNHGVPPSPADSNRSHSENANDANQPMDPIRRRISAVASSSLNLSLIPRSNHLISQLQAGNSDLTHQKSSANSNGGGGGPLQQSTSSSSSSSSFNISPLRNKIKKASSFERFSLAQAAVISNAAANNNSTTSQQQVINNESISSIPPTNNNSNSNNSGTNKSVSVAGPSKGIWDPSPPPPPSESLSSSLLQRSFISGHTDKFHIKIPSKKLAAKIASVYEQEQLNESLAAAEAISSVGSKRPSLASSMINNHQSQNELGSGGSQIIQPPSTLAQILNQTPSNIHVNSMMTEESIMNQQDVSHENLIRELGVEAPLNLTESTSSSSFNTAIIQSNSQQSSSVMSRNPVISSSRSLTSSTHTKKILTPKQKLLHRLQTGELMSSLSPPPPPMTMSQPIQQQQSLPVSTIQQQQQQQQPVVTLHQSLPMVQQEPLQQPNIGGNTNHLVMGNSPHSPPQQQMDAYAYETLLRSRDEFIVPESLGKVVGEDSTAVSNMLSVYDPDNYSYYYQSILGDEIFTGNNNPGGVGVGGSNSRQLLMMPSGNLQDIDQPQGHLEFVLGFSGNVEDQDNDRHRDDELQQLNNDGNPGSQQQYSIDPNDALSAIKSQSQADSTLRNLLMMEPMRNNHSSNNDDSSWLSLAAAAAAEYQNKLSNNPDRGGVGGPIPRNSSSISIAGSSGNSVGSIISGGISTSNSQQQMNNSWINEWPRTTSWQSHPSNMNLSGGVQDQDEVMDMSMMDHVKGNQQKRQQNNNDHSMDEMDLTTASILSMPIDLQQPISIMSHGSNSKDSLPMDLQQHHRMDIDDEPVNLISVNMEQELSSHHQNQHHSMEKTGQLSHHQSSYALQIQQQSHHSQQQQELQLSSDLNGNNSNSSSDNIDERRIIRVKKAKDSVILMNNLEEDCQNDSQDGQHHSNVIMDSPIQPKSIASLPSPLRLARISGNELAVFNSTMKNIPANCRLGPVEGPLKKAIASDIANVNATYPCLVMADGCNVLWQLDRSDDEFCNWMKFVRVAHSIKDQNALVVESDGYLYFMTCKDIPPNTELQVGYSYEYAQKYGFPYLLPIDGFIEEENNRMVKDVSMTGKSMIINQQHSPPQDDNQEQHSGSNNNAGPSRNIQPQEQQQERPKMIIVETYSCFECDQEFNLVEDLQAHLNTHKDTEEIRKPKRKAIKKFQIPESLSDYSKNIGNISINVVPGGQEDREEQPPIQLQIQQQPQPKSSNQPGLNEFVSADSSMGAIEPPSSPISSDKGTVTVTTGADLGKPQDNSVTTGVGQPSLPPKVKCSMCYKSFANKERLEKHMIVHSDEDTKPLKCSFCTKRFLTNSALAGHTKTHAEEGKFFECPMCNFSTPQLLQLKEHVQTHKNRETGLFYCPQCPKKFSAYPMIRKHIRAFHGPRQFSCDSCPMSFPTSDKLKLHQLKHSDHREFLCAQCGRQFKRKDKLREHTKRIHETNKKSIEINIPKDKNSKKFIPKVAPEEYQKFPFKCQDCMVGFKRRGMLVNHLAKKHPEKKIKSIPELNQPILRLTRNYPCLYCERVYKSSSKRKAHILKAHPGKPIPPQLRGASTPSSEILNEVVRPLVLGHTGTIVQTVTDDGDPRKGIMNVSCTNNISSTKAGSSDIVSTTSAAGGSNSRKEAIVGKIAALPHACQWCYREYATRAKLLQHQRKAHISLMPTEMQTPRTQKNNVAKMKKEKLSQSEATASTVDLSALKSSTGSILNVIQSTKTIDASAISIPDSTSTASTTTTTIQTVADGVNEGNVIGFLLTTTNGELGNLLPSEIVMLPMQNINNPNVNLSSQTQSLAISGNPTQNIAIIASSNNISNNSGNNAM